MVVEMILVVGMIVVVGMIMFMVMMLLTIFMVLRFRLTGSAYFHRIVTKAASAGVTHSYSFCSTSKDFICNSVPLISRIPGF
jgi:hypothetical protein